MEPLSSAGYQSNLLIFYSKYVHFEMHHSRLDNIFCQIKLVTRTQKDIVNEAIPNDNVGDGKEENKLLGWKHC